MLYKQFDLFYVVNKEHTALKIAQIVYKLFTITYLYLWSLTTLQLDLLLLQNTYIAFCLPICVSI